MPTQISQYVAGFMFDARYAEHVALIKKTKPPWQNGLLNGIGGKIEPGESPAQAMVREFREETGCQTAADQWKFFVTISGSGWQVFFAVTAGELGLLKSTTAEMVQVLDMSAITSWNLVPNLCWILPLARYVLRAPAFVSAGFVVERNFLGHIKT